MTKDEFVELHGEELWEQVVKPLQDLNLSVYSANANAIIHDWIARVKRDFPFILTREAKLPILRSILRAFTRYLGVKDERCDEDHAVDSKDLETQTGDETPPSELINEIKPFSWMGPEMQALLSSRLSEDEMIALDEHARVNFAG